MFCLNEVMGEIDRLSNRNSRVESRNLEAEVSLLKGSVAVVGSGMKRLSAGFAPMSIRRFLRTGSWDERKHPARATVTRP